MFGKCRSNNKESDKDDPVIAHYHDTYVALCQQLVSYSNNKRGSGGAMMLGKFPVPGRPTNVDGSWARPTALAVGAGGACLDIFTIIYDHFACLYPSL